MDDLGRDLNEAFEKQQADLGNLAGTKERLMRDASAAHQQRTASRAQFAVGVAAVLIAAVVVATFAYIRAGSQPTNGGPFPKASASPDIRPQGLWPRTANLAYDSARAQVVVFGGVTDAPASNDTWVWDGHGWAKKSSATDPPKLEGAAVADDPEHNVVVLFGGDDVGFYYAETWLWNGSQWNQVFPAHIPSQRTGAAMTYDPVHHVVLLFGGHDANNDLDDTWVWDGTDWTRKSPTTWPPARQSARLAFDAARGNAVLFGGFDGLNDTWTWDGSNWTKRNPAAVPPALRQANPVPQQMVYDVARKVVVMVDSTQHAAELAQNTMDTWTWDGTNWNRLTPADSPNPRDGFGLAYDESRSVTVLAGGQSFDFDMVSTWTWDGVNWNAFGTVGPAPTPSPAATRSPASGLAVVDADPLDASKGWVLLTNCVTPMTGKCHYSVTATADAGQTWSKSVQVGPSFNPTDGDAPRSIRVINPMDGFVYGGTVAFATHDGGRTWGTVGVNANFFAQHAITGRGNNAWLLTYPCPKATPCSYEVRSSVDGGKTWSSPSSLPAGFSPLDSIPIGSNGLLVSSAPLGDMELTHDGGTTWNLVRSQCGVDSPRALVAAADGNELWELCSSFQKFAPQKFFVSKDGGKSWSPHATSQLPPEQSLAPFSIILVSTKPGTALTASNLSTISITHDGGATWTRVGPDGVAFQSIRFATTTQGWALDIYKNIWSTSDGGDHWTLLQGPA